MMLQCQGHRSGCLKSTCLCNTVSSSILLCYACLLYKALSDHLAAAAACHQVFEPWVCHQPDGDGSLIAAAWQEPDQIHKSALDGFLTQYGM